MTDTTAPHLARTSAFILAGGQGERLYPLTASRPKPAVSFGGKFRIIDFTLFNCLRSGLSRVSLLTQYKYEALHRYIREDWSDLWNHNIERNVLATGSVVGTAARPQVIRVVNTGSYLIAHNSIDCGWPGGDAEGIGVFSQIAGWPMEGAIVEDNDVTMSPPEGSVFGDFSAAIGVYGFAEGNVVLNNRIRGRARAALAVIDFRGGTPDKTALIRNRFADFEASRADVFVDVGVTNTVILGQRGTVEDHGVNTVIRANVHP